MLECLPERVRHLRPASTAVMIAAVEEAHADPPTVIVSQVQRGRTNIIGRFAWDDLCEVSRLAPQTVRLQLPADALLDRIVTLPLAAERDIARVLAYDLDRLTPFRAAEIFWCYSVEQRNRASGRLTVRLSLVLRAPWRPLLTALVTAGLAVTTIEVACGNSHACRFELAAKPSRRGLRVGSALFALLATTMIVLPFILQSLALDVLEQRIQALRPLVVEAEALRHAITSGSGTADLLAAERARMGNVLAVLTDVTAALPDDTYLNSLSMRQGHLVLAGRSGGAAKLIGALSDDRLIRNAAFDAPTTRTDQITGDLFSIRADLATGP
jgi:general secretion pathway protein L